MYLNRFLLIKRPLHPLLISCSHKFSNTTNHKNTKTTKPFTTLTLLQKQISSSKIPLCCIIISKEETSQLEPSVCELGVVVTGLPTYGKGQGGELVRVVKMESVEEKGMEVMEEDIVPEIKNTGREMESGKEKEEGMESTMKKKVEEIEKIERMEDKEVSVPEIKNTGREMENGKEKEGGMENIVKKKVDIENIEKMEDEENCVPEIKNTGREMETERKERKEIENIVKKEVEEIVKIEKMEEEEEEEIKIENTEIQMGNERLDRKEIESMEEKKVDEVEVENMEEEYEMGLVNTGRDMETGKLHGREMESMEEKEKEKEKIENLEEKNDETGTENREHNTVKIGTIEEGNESPENIEIENRQEEKAYKRSRETDSTNIPPAKKIHSSASLPSEGTTMQSTTIVSTHTHFAEGIEKNQNRMTTEDIHGKYLLREKIEGNEGNLCNQTRSEHEVEMNVNCKENKMKTVIGENIKEKRENSNQNTSKQEQEIITNPKEDEAKTVIQENVKEKQENSSYQELKMNTNPKENQIKTANQENIKEKQENSNQNTSKQELEMNTNATEQQKTKLTQENTVKPTQSESKQNTTTQNFKANINTSYNNNKNNNNKKERDETANTNVGEKREGEGRSTTRGMEGMKSPRGGRKEKWNWFKKDSTRGKYKEKKQRPNYFVGIQITNPQIHRAIVTVQEGLLAGEESLGKALVDVATAHITLFVTHLEGQKDLDVAISALEESATRIKDEISANPINLTFSGLGHFNNQVLFADVCKDASHHRLAEVSKSIRSVFVERGVCVPDERDQRIHLTIAKLSKAPSSRSKNAMVRRIDQSHYREYKDLHFGTQTVAGIQLLSMSKGKDKNRYYHSDKEVQFDIKVEEDKNHTSCCFPRRPTLPPHTTPHRHLSTTTTTTGDTSSRPGSFLVSMAGVTTLLAGALVAGFIIARLRR